MLYAHIWILYAFYKKNTIANIIYMGITDMRMKQDFPHAKHLLQAYERERERESTLLKIGGT